MPYGNYGRYLCYKALVTSTMKFWLLLLYETLIVSTMGFSLFSVTCEPITFTIRDLVARLVVFAMRSWSLLLYRTCVCFAMRPWLRPLYGIYCCLFGFLSYLLLLKNLDCLQYMGSLLVQSVTLAMGDFLLLQLVAFNTWDLVTFILHENFFATALYEIYFFCYVTFAMSISSK